MAGPTKEWVKVVSPSGVVTEVHPDDVASKLALSEGSHIETPHEKEVREYLAGKGQSIGQQALGVVEEAGSQLSFGGLDYLGRKLGGEQWVDDRNLRREIPGVVPAGIAASLVVPVGAELAAASAAKKGIAVGKLGKAAAVAGGPINAVSHGAARLGSMSEKLVAGAAPGALRRVGAKAAGGVIAGTVEGAAIGAGMALSEASLQNKDLSAELLLARMGETGAVGGVLGGAIGTVGGLFGIGKAGAKAAVRHVPGIGEVVGQDANQLVGRRSLRSLGFQRSDFNRVIKKIGPEAVDEIGDTAAGILKVREPGAFGRAVKYQMEDGAELVAARKGELNNELRGVYADIGEDTQALSSIARRADNEVIAPLRNSLSGGDRAGIAAIEREIRPIRRALQEAEGFAGAARSIPALETRLGELGTLAAQGEYDALRLATKSFRRELADVSEHYSSLGMSNSANQAKRLGVSLQRAADSNGRGIYDLMGQVRERFDLLSDSVGRHVTERGSPRITAAEIWELAKKTKEKFEGFKFTRDPKEHVYRQYWQILKDELQTIAERHGLGEQLQRVNRDLRNVIAIDEVAQKAAGFSGNRGVSLTDTLAAGSMGGAGAIVGGGFGGAIGAAAGATLNRFIRSAAGDQLMAVTANKYATLRKTVDAVDREAAALSREVREAIPVKQRAISVGARGASEFDREHDALVARQTDQQRMLDELTSRMTEATEVAPELSAALVTAGARGQAYLASQLPAAIEIGDLRDRAGKPSIPESERAAWLRKLTVVKDPKSVIRAMANGELTSLEVDALRASSPELYAWAQRELLHELETAAIDGRLPTYEQRAQASTFTGMPLDASFKPENIARFQARYAQLRDKPGESPGVTAGTRITSASKKLAGNRQTATERREA